ncbi:MAG: hypothetical protein INR65_10600 [Gluconacetobacter diazotrophicus]|nr:hypothetical protein [Gluconacetobacter diazotrophicus]
MDPDRFLCALFVPAAVRTEAFALVCLHHELERAVFGTPGRSAHGPVAAMIRLGWWREVLAGEREDWRGNDLAVRVRAVTARGAPVAAVLGGMVEAYEDAAAGIEDAEGWRTLLERGPGGLQEAVAILVGDTDPVALARARTAGAAHALGRRAGRTGGDGEELDAAGECRRLLTLARGALPARDRRAPLLPAVLAARDLARGDGGTAETGRGVMDRLAVAWTALRPGGGLRGVASS